MNLTLLAILAIAAWTDLKKSQVPNQLIALGIVVGIVGRLILYRGYGLFSSFMGMMIPLILLAFFYAVRVVGAGDVKLFMVLGCIKGSGRIWERILLIFMTAAGLCLFKMWRQGNLQERLRYLADYFETFVRTGKLSEYGVGRTEKQALIPLAVPIFLGTLLAELIY